MPTSQLLADSVTYAPAHGFMHSMWLLVAIPLASSAVLLVLGKRADKWGHWLGVLAVAATFVIGLIDFFSLRDLPANARNAEVNLWSFIPVGNLRVEFGMLFDPLTAIFVLLITGVGLLIHVYAVGYMATTRAAAASSGTSTSSSRPC